MKKGILLALAIMPAAVWAQVGSFSINAKIDTATASEKAYLLYKKADVVIRDSAILHQGEFSFKGNVTEPTEARLVLDHSGAGLDKLGSTPDYKVIFLEKAVINITSKDSIMHADISGSKLNDENAAYQAMITRSEKSIDALNKEYTSAPDFTKNDPQFTAGLQARGNKLLEERKSFQKQFIQQHPDSYISLVLLLALGHNEPDLKALNTLFKSLSPAMQATTDGRSFANALSVAYATSIGAQALDFTLNDVNDQPVSLKDFRGKYVLLDFWASWCGPCRAENPNVVKTFNQFKNKNFTVLGVSLDRPGKKEDWLAAIKNDGLAWTQVSDLKFWHNEAALKYNITSIPQNYLIGPDGKIIAKNLHGDELNEKLTSLFN